MDGNNTNNQKFFFDEDFGYQKKVSNNLTNKQALTIIENAISATSGELKSNLKELKEWALTKNN